MSNDKETSQNEARDEVKLIGSAVCDEDQGHVRETGKAMSK